mmetsp:Transcript_44347/g.105658  ORF Transcript_44347/g.105658 Transcript_44347/m.105658 type:complete len:317 (-) Transcript_44347:6-956(-)
MPIWPAEVSTTTTSSAPDDRMPRAVAPLRAEEMPNETERRDASSQTITLPPAASRHASRSNPSSTLAAHVCPPAPSNAPPPRLVPADAESSTTCAAPGAVATMKSAPLPFSATWVSVAPRTSLVHFQRDFPESPERICTMLSAMSATSSIWSPSTSATTRTLMSSRAALRVASGVATAAPTLTPVRSSQMGRPSAAENIRRNFPPPDAVTRTRPEWCMSSMGPSDARFCRHVTPPLRASSMPTKLECEVTKMRRLLLSGWKTACLIRPRFSRWKSLTPTMSSYSEEMHTRRDRSTATRHAIPPPITPMLLGENREL